MFAPRRLRFPVRGFVGIALFFAAATVALHAQEGTLWVGETAGAFRIATADGTFLGEIAGAGQQVPALAVDPLAERVWLCAWHSTGQSLDAYSLAGELELSVPVPGSPLQVPEMAVDPVAGTVWLADLVQLDSRRVTGFDASGQVVAEVSAPEQVRSLEVDSQAGLVWVAGERDLYAYDTTSGLAARTSSLGPSAPLIQAIAVGTGGALWVATEDDLRRLASDGTEELRASLPGLRHVAADGAGGAWAAETVNVLRVGADGAVTVPAQTSGGWVVDLAPDSRDGSVWVATNSSIAHLGGDGGVIVSLSVPLLNLGPFVLVRDIDLWRPALPPSVTIEAPEEGAAVSAARPEILIAFVPGDQAIDPGSLAVTADGSPLPVDCDLDAAGGSCTPVAPLAEGPVALTVTIADVAGRPSEPATVSFTVDTVAPVVMLASPEDGELTNQPDQVFTGSVSEPAELTLGGTPVTVAPDLTFSYGPVTLTEGPNAFTLAATDAAGNTGTLTVTLTLDTVAPDALEVAAIEVTPPDVGAVTVTGGPGAAEPGATVTVANGGAGTSVEAAADGTFTLALAAAAEDVLSAFQADAAGNVGPTINLTVPSPEPGEDVPPDPATVAPPLDRTVATDVAAATEFLYTGPDPIQIGVAPGTIEPRRAAVIRGRVVDRSGAPLSGVRVSVRGHSEYGSTLTRTDGMFDLAVNGGGIVMVDYEKEGYLPAQRAVEAPWRDWRWADEVVLVALDPQATTVTSDATEVQVARGGTVTDTAGERTATLLVPAGTAAEMVLADGSRQPLPSWTLRATEYTVGESGPAALPGPLPPEVAYTYAVELSSDEAIAAGARSVELSQPAFLYVDNFLHFPVGEIVPVGWYDRQLAAWVASDNGRVIEVVGVDGVGRAELDLDGDGAAESAIDLAEAGVTDGERTELATLYPVGAELWRTPIPHLTPWDCNWPYAPPADAENPPEDDPNQDEGRDEDDSPCTQGSIIECQNQVLGEVVPIVGTPFRLHYGSDRVRGRTASYTLPIRVSGSSVPASLKRIELEIEVAGQRTERRFLPEPDQHFTFTWDGNDAYGRPVQGASRVSVRKTYVYDNTSYATAEDFERSWARFPSSSFRIVGDAPETSEFRLSRTSTYSVALEGRAELGGWDAPAERLGGWTLDIHHTFDPTARRLWLGDGRRRSARALPPLVYGVADVSPEALAFGPDGSLYVTEKFDHRVLRIAPSGAVFVVAGDGTPCEAPDPDDPEPPPPCGDAGPATSAQLFEPEGVAVGPDGSVLIADTGNNCVRRVGTDGIIQTVAGRCTGQGGGGPVFIVTPGGPTAIAARASDIGCDDCPATDALLAKPSDVAVAPDGSFYVSDTDNILVRRVGTDGRIVTVGGGGSPSDGVGDGGPATEAQILFPESLALAPDGSLYVVERDISRIRHITLDGRISRVTGGFALNFCGDGGPAVDACVSDPSDIAVAPDGSILIADTNNRRVRRISPGGIIDTVAGGKDGGVLAEIARGDAAGAVDLDFVVGVAVAPDGQIYFGQRFGVLRLGPSLETAPEAETLIPEAGGEVVFVFDSQGRHLRTVDALTGNTLLTFLYGAAGLLTQVEDMDGNLTRIERDGSGDATAIVAPFGQRTVLRNGVDGYLSEIENPAGETTAMTYSTDGLLESFTDPRGNASTYTYFGSGRLARAEDAAGGFKTLTRTQHDHFYDVDVTTALGRTTSHRVEHSGPGKRTRREVGPDHTVTESLDDLDGSRTTTFPDRSEVTAVKKADPRWGLRASIPGDITVETPGGLVASLSAGRTVSLSDPDDPLALATLVDTVTLNGATYTRAYDASTRSLTVTTPEGRQRFLTLDGKGRAIRAEVPGVAPLELSYDPSGRLSEVAQGTGTERRTMSLGYDTHGLLAEITDELGRTTGLSRDLAGRVTTQTLPDGRTIGFGYDPNGDLTALTPPARPDHAFTHSPVNLPVSYDPPDVPGVASDTTGYTFDLDRQLQAVSRPGGETLDPVYDPDTGRLTSLGLDGGETLGFGYNFTTGQLTSISGPDNVGLAYGYDGFLVTGTTWSGEVSGSVTYSYDENFRVVEQTVAGAGTISFSYDDDGLLLSAGDLGLALDPANGLLGGTQVGQLTTSRTYNSFGELATASASFAGTALYRAVYAHDRLGRIVEKIETVEGVTSTWEYTYDLVGRLVEVTRDGAPFASYTYDANGNRLTYSGTFGTATASYDDQDRLLTYGDATYAYTPAGELLSKTQGTATVGYECDALGNLRRVNLPDGLEIEYVVDGLSRRVGKKVDGELVRGFLYQDALNPVAELDGAGAVVARFFYGTRSNVLDYMIKGGATYRLVSDHLGSVRLAVDTETGAISQRLDYDEFGRVTLDTNPGFQPFGFAGGLYDPQTGLVRFGARDYDAEVGRWTAKDPIGFGGRDANLYRYGLNDPINSLDPTGLINFLLGVGGNGTIITGVEASGGVFVNPGIGESEADLGLFGSVGATLGFQAGLDLFAGFALGTPCDVQGSTVNVNVNAGPLSFTGFLDSETGDFLGLTIGLGPSFPPVGASISGAATGTLTVRGN